MRGAWIIAAALVVGAVTGPARAGVYFTTGTTVRQFANPEDPDAQELWPQPNPFDQFEQDLAGYRSAASELPSRVAAAVWTLTGDALPSTPAVPLSAVSSIAAHNELPPVGKTLGMHYLLRAAELEARESRGLLSLDDRINLGAYYLRLGNSAAALRVLEKAQTSRHFMLRANLATAYEMAGQPDRALLYRQLALSSWPNTYSGWNTAQLNFYRKAEQLHLTLLQLRQAEASRQPNRTGLRLDALFPGLQFVGPHGEYEAGTIAPAQWCEMPTDAGFLVMQLLLWTPFDDRLYWMLGELLNATGDVKAAAAMMKLVVNKPQDPRKWESGAPQELRDHYRVVSEEAKAREKLANELMTLNDPLLTQKLLCALAPRGTGLGAGDLLREAGWPATALAGQPANPKDNTQTPPPATTTSGWLPDPRTLGVGFAAGAVVALLLGYQIRQARAAKG